MKAARQALRAAIRRLDAALEPLARRASIEGIHQARAAARKIGDTLSTFDVEVSMLKEQADVLKDAIGDVRDLHVRGLRGGPTLARATAAMRKTMVDWRRVRPLVENALDHLVATGSPKKLLHHRLRKLEKRIDHLPTRTPAQKAHRLRMKTKRAQTAVALIAPRQKALLKKLKKASKVLGKLHDLDAGLVTAGHTRSQLVHEVKPALEELRSEL